MLFTEKCLSCANANQMCCNICGVGRNGEREKYKPKPQTHADTIRSLSDEELADFMADYADCGVCHEKFALDYCGSSKKTCNETWYDWLKQEAEK